MARYRCPTCRRVKVTIADAVRPKCGTCRVLMAPEPAAPEIPTVASRQSEPLDAKPPKSWPKDARKAAEALAKHDRTQ